MKHVILPAETKVRTTKYGPMPVGTVKPGDTVTGFNYDGRPQGVCLTISDVKPLPDKMPALSLSLHGVSSVSFAEDTIILTRTGPRRVSACPNHLIGVCVINPNQPLTRQISMALPLPNLKMVELFWDGPYYLLAEGCLVGDFYAQ
jgi:hypothetical protein